MEALQQWGLPYFGNLSLGELRDIVRCAVAERGILGLVTFLFLIAAALRRVGQGFRTAGLAAERRFAEALGSCWAVFLVMGAISWFVERSRKKKPGRSDPPPSKPLPA